MEHRFVRHPEWPILGCKCGAVANLAGYILRPRPDKDGYLIVDCGPRGKRKTVRVSRTILGCFEGPDPREADHRNRDRADNRYSNLRYLDIVANRRNIGVRKHSTSGIRNVRWREDKHKWQAYCRIDGRFRSLGHFDTAEAAKRAAEPFYEARA